MNKRIFFFITLVFFTNLMYGQLKTTITPITFKINNISNFGSSDSNLLYIGGQSIVFEDSALNTDAYLTSNLLERRQIELSISPNPMKNFFIIKNLKRQQIREILLYTVNGQLLQSDIPKNGSAQELRIFTHNNYYGVLFVVLIIDKQKYTFKLQSIK